MIKLAKIGLFGLFLNYFPYNIMTGSLIPKGTYIFLAIILLGVFGDKYSKANQCGTYKAVKIWIIYGLLALVTSVFARSTNVAVRSLVDFFIKIAIIFAIAYICEREDSIRFAVSLLAITALLSAVTGFIQMGNISDRFDLESGASVSANDFGALMAYGCFAITLFLRDSDLKSKFLVRALTIASVILMMIEIFVSGSRKSLYAVIVLYIMLALFIWSRKVGKINVPAAVATVMVGIAVLLVYRFYLEPHLADTSLYLRLFGRKAEASAESDQGRWLLYSAALEKFAEYPLFGLGYNNFQYVYGGYTHSTYVEPLACNGIIGILYLAPLVSILIKQISLSTNKMYDREQQNVNRELLIFYIIFLFIGIGIPYMYKEVPCIVLGMMIAWQRLADKRAERSDYIEANKSIADYK